MRQFILKYKYHFFLVVLGVLSVLLFDCLSQMHLQKISCPDCDSYYVAAESLYVFYRGNHYRPMLIAAINGVPFLFGFSGKAVYDYNFYVNLVCWLTTTLVVFELAKQFLTARKAFLIASVSLFLVGNIALIFQLMSENVYMCAIALVFFFMMQYNKNGKYRHLATALCIAILSILIKPVSLFPAIIFCLFFMSVLLRHYRSKWTFLIYSAVFAVIIQCAGIKYQFGNFTVSYVDGLTYYDYLGSKAKCIRDGAVFDQQNNPYAVYNITVVPSEQKKIIAEDLKLQLQYNKINLGKAYLDDILGNTFSGSAYVMLCNNIRQKTYFETAKSLLLKLSEWQNILFTIIGFLLSVWYFFRGNRNDRIIAIFILYIMVSSGISCDQGDRFHVITFPFVLVLMARFIMEIKKIKPRAVPLQT